jgi:hypothetical protein
MQICKLLLECQLFQISSSKNFLHNFSLPCGCKSDSYFLVVSSMSSSDVGLKIIFRNNFLHLENDFIETSI